MGCNSSKTATRPVSTPAGTLLSAGDDNVKSPKATAIPEPTAAPADMQSDTVPFEATPPTAEGVKAAPLTAERMQQSTQDAQVHKEELTEPADPPKNYEKPKTVQEPTSKVHKNPQGWEEEGILFPHEGIRFLMQELSDAVESMDPLPGWKWENLSTWYQDYFYSVVHHHHDAEEKIYFPWIQERVAVPAKIAADHPDLMQAMDDVSDMLKKGISAPAHQRAEHLTDMREVVKAFVEDMQEHLAEEEEVIPCLLREGGFTQEEEGAVVGQIIQSLGLDGNKKALPTMLHAYARWAGAEKADAFVSTNLPLPIQLLYRNFWVHDFQHRHLGLLASLAEGVDTNPFPSKWFC